MLVAVCLDVVAYNDESGRDWGDISWQNAACRAMQPLEERLHRTFSCLGLSALRCNRTATDAATEADWVVHSTAPPLPHCSTPQARRNRGRYGELGD